MLRQCFTGGLVSLANIATHALVMTLVVAVARRAHRAQVRRSPLWLPRIMIVTGAILLIAHAVSVSLWAAVYVVVGAAPVAERALYLAFVNYTTLGYGDLVPVRAWELLGPITAMNGIFLFGWTTAVTFEVLREAMRTGDKPS
jgi:hypothetical protein